MQLMMLLCDRLWSGQQHVIMMGSQAMAKELLSLHCPERDGRPLLMHGRNPVVDRRQLLVHGGIRVGPEG